MHGIAAKKPREILVAVDFSETSASAFDRACELAAGHGARLRLAHVLPDPAFSPGGLRSAEVDALASNIQSLAKGALERLAKRARETCEEVETLLCVGAPGPELARVVAESDVDLVVIGTRGLSGLEHLRLGSTAEYVVRAASCPVLTLHPTDDVFMADLRTVLVPTDLGGDPAAVAEAVVALVGPAARQAHAVLHYSDHLPSYVKPWIADLQLGVIPLDQIREHVEKRLEPAVARLQSLGFSVETVVTEGDPADTICEVASSQGVDLIAMTTHGRSGVAHAFLGSISERVVQRADRPVLTLRRAE